MNRTDAQRATGYLKLQLKFIFLCLTCLLGTPSNLGEKIGRKRVQTKCHEFEEVKLVILQVYIYYFTCM